MKFDDYLRVSALKANLSEKHIWEIIKNNHNNYKEVMVDIMKDTPDEFQKEVESIVKNFEIKIGEHRINTEKLCKEFEDKTDKELELYFKDNMSIYASIIFNMRKGKSIENELIKLVKLINDL